MPDKEFQFDEKIGGRERELVFNHSVGLEGCTVERERSRKLSTWQSGS